MSSSGVGPEQENPFGKSYPIDGIEQIRRDRHEKEGQPSSEPPDEASPGLTALVLLFLDKVFGALKQSIRKRAEAAPLDSARENFLMIKAAFETMKLEDRSQDVQFLKRLSTLWQTVLEHSIDLQTKAPVSKPLKAFIKEIENYSENGGHTFGYYLDEYAGQHWLPFPYMELIQKLHHQYESDPPSSLLSRWTLLIEDLLDLL